MYKKIYIFLILKYNCFFSIINQSSIEIFSNVFFISSLLQNTINIIDIKNIYSLNKSTIENLNFAGNTFIIGSKEIQTDIFFNNLPVIEDATDYVMIDPSIMQIYIGNENNPEPPTPDIITIPNLITDQMISGDNGLYINNIDFSTQLGNKSGVISINTNEVIFNAPIESKSLFIYFNSPVVFKTNVNKVENISAKNLFCISGIDKIYFNTLSITDSINTTKNKISFGKPEISPGIICNGTMTINENLNTNFGSPNNNEISIINIPIYSNNNRSNINYLILNNANNILKANIQETNINQPILTINSNFLVNEIRLLNQNQSVTFSNFFCACPEININKASCTDFYYFNLNNNLALQKFNVNNFNINNFLCYCRWDKICNYYFMSDSNYKSSFSIKNIRSPKKDIKLNNLIYFKLLTGSEVSNKIGYNIINNTLVKIMSKVNDSINKNKNNLNDLQLESSELNKKIKTLELIYQKLLIISNMMGL